MDGPSCREFYDHLTRTFPANAMPLKNLFITSGLVLRPDGKIYNYNTLKMPPHGHRFPNSMKCWHVFLINLNNP